MDRYDVFQHFGTQVTLIAVVWATNAADALGVVVGANARIVSARWIRHPEVMVSSVRERDETAHGTVYAVRILQARRWNPGKEGTVS